jgi:hypothetical protein
MSIELKHLRYADAAHRCQHLKSGGSCRLIGSMPANVRASALSQYRPPKSSEL